MSGAGDGAAHRDKALRRLAVLAVVLVAFAVFAFVSLRTDRLPTRGPSMRPTITSRTAVRIDTGAYEGRDPEVGDIIVLQGPAGIREEGCGAPHPPGSPCPVAVAGYDRIRLLKRVVGAPGDRIAFRADGHVVRNGAVAKEPFITECPGTCSLPRPITVPPQHLFVAGDNRLKSSDSRFWGAVPREAVDAKVILDP